MQIFSPRALISECDVSIPKPQPDITNEGQTGQLSLLETYKKALLPVDPEVVGYIYETVHFKDQFNSLLEEQGIQFDWKADNTLANITYSGDDEEERLKAVQSFLETFAKCEIQVKKDIWDMVLPHILNYCSSLTEDAPKIQTFKDDLKVRIISSRSDIAYHKQSLKRMILEVCKEATFDSEIITNYSKLYITFLRKINFVENQLQKKCKEVRVDFDEENLNVFLRGPREQLEIAKDEFLEQELATCAKQLELPQVLLETLCTKEGRQAIEEVLQNNELTCVVSITKHDRLSDDLIGKVLGNSNEDVTEAATQISKVVALKKIQLEESNVALTSTPEWSNLCENITAKTGVRIQDKDLPNVLVVGLRDDVLKTVEKLQQFLHKNSIRKEQFACRSKCIKQYLIQTRQDDLQLIEEKLHTYDVKIMDGEDKNFCISGRGDGLQQAKRLLVEIAEKIAFTSCTIDQPGLRKTFERGRGESIVKTIGEDHKCLIRVIKKFHHTNGRPTETQSDSDDDNSDLMTSVEDPSIFTVEGYKISWKIGNIAEEQVS